MEKYFWFLPSVFFTTCFLLLACEDSTDQHNSIIWELNNLEEIGGHAPEVLGSPELVTDEARTSIRFNGVSDGLILSTNPVDGWDQFTVEVFFKPDSDGPEEQRFVHFQDENANRGLIETRINPDGRWALDTFLYNSSLDSGLTLLDRDINHPGDDWVWAALTYDGTTMSHYVNGNKELEGDIEFGPIGPGMISLGVRLNQVHWFKGEIQEIRFHPASLSASELQVP
jgi:hypothetical protein